MHYRVQGIGVGRIELRVKITANQEHHNRSGEVKGRHALSNFI